MLLSGHLLHVELIFYIQLLSKYSLLDSVTPQVALILQIYFTILCFNDMCNVQIIKSNLVLRTNFFDFDRAKINLKLLIKSLLKNIEHKMMMKFQLSIVF